MYEIPTVPSYVNGVPATQGNITGGPLTKRSSEYLADWSMHLNGPQNVYEASVELAVNK